MVKNNPSAWPESRAFQYMIRTLWRQRDYIPPYQPNNAFPLAMRPPGEVSATDDTATPQPRVASARRRADTVVAVGPWTLATNSRGDLVWRHESGHEQIAAALPSTEEDHHG